MKSFNCSKTILNNLLLVFDNQGDMCYAHLSKDRLVRESLFEHTKLVSDYCLKLIENKISESLINSLLWKVTESLPISNKICWGNLLKEIFLAAIVYHDLGKVNPNFQALKMENEKFSQDKKLSLQSNHSFLGAFIYSTIFFKKVFEDENLDEDEKLTLYFIILLFSGAIIKHHNSTIDFVVDWDFEQINDCYSFLQRFGVFWDKNVSLSFYRGANDIFSDFRCLVKAPTAYFNLFATNKILYSLLTASDFYATNEFMSKVHVDEFGVLNKGLKKDLIYSFRTVKSYNRNLYLNLSYYQKHSFDDLLERNNQNLNVLRQKITEEMIRNLRMCLGNRCFYLEAPTGAGKTNLSLAFATELMESDDSINQLFYVFPFTTLITQTFSSIKDTLSIGNDTVIQIHSKAGFHEKGEGTYGIEKRLFIDNFFVNYPIGLISHVRFFDILKGNEKESNYLLHRLCNSIVIIDEIQTYNPEHWDKIVYFLVNYAELFNLRVLIMSATLPKIDALHENMKGSFFSLISNRDLYFKNPNFAERVLFDFSLLNKNKPNNEEKENYLIELSEFLYEKANRYAIVNGDKIKVLIEFISKKTASIFFKILTDNKIFKDYKILLLSGDILEFKRKEIIRMVKDEDFSKIILVATQVVETGVDIDMDLGFKDRSLIDSDEQLAGRINRNAFKENCIVYLFNCDDTRMIYGSDFRYKIQQTNDEIFEGYKEILVEKKFHVLYEKVFQEKKRSMNSNMFASGHYYLNFRNFNFQKLHDEFRLIEDNDSVRLFIPTIIPIQFFDNNSDLEKMNVLTEDRKNVDGSKVFNFYEQLFFCQLDDFIVKEIELKKLGSIMSQFCISVYRKQLESIFDMLDPDKSKYGYKYLLNWELCYSPSYGFDSKKIDTSVFI